MATIVESFDPWAGYPASAYPVEAFRFDDGTVVHVEPDTDSENPCDWYSNTILCVYRAGYWSINEDDRGDVLVRAFLEYRYRGEDDERALILAQRYARTFYGDERVAILGKMDGYSASDWAEYIAVGEHAAMLAASWEQWARGDIYTAYTEDDSLGSIYADSAEDAAKIFHDEMIGD